MSIRVTFDEKNMSANGHINAKHNQNGNFVFTT